MLARFMIATLLTALVVLFVACSATDADETGHVAKQVKLELYGLDRVLEVHIELADADWQTLRFESPGLEHYMVPSCTTGPRPRPFHYQPATVTIDGKRFEDAEVRKKGFKGTMTPQKPSLKVRLHTEDRIGGQRRLTLNNSAQDGNYISQCLAYGLFAAAGLPAPRCGFAHVTVNGVDHGVYVHVEGIKKPMIERTFGHFEGHLYENTLADFAAGTLQIFERKNKKKDNNRPELLGIQQALDGPDDALLVSLGKWLDMDAYFTYWAMEVLTGHWDGYHGNRNNNYAFFDHKTKQLTFMPWGVDATFSGPWNFWGPFLEESNSLPRAVYAHGRIGQRLYSLPEGRERYFKRLGELLDAVWNEKALLGQIDTMQKAIAPLWTANGAKRATARIEIIKKWIQEHRAALLPAIKGEHPEFTLTTGALPLCGDVTLTVSGTFSTIFNTLDDNPLEHGKGELSAAITGKDGAVKDHKMGLVRGVAGPISSIVDEGAIELLVGFGPLPGGGFLALQISLPPELFVAGQTVKLDYGEGGVDVGRVNLTNGKTSAVGFVLGGTMTFSKAGTGDGDEVAFEINAPVTRLAAQ